MEVPQLIIDLAIMLSTAAVVTIVFKKLRIPTILGYILAGFLIILTYCLRCYTELLGNLFLLLAFTFDENIYPPEGRIHIGTYIIEYCLPSPLVDFIRYISKEVRGISERRNCFCYIAVRELNVIISYLLSVTYNAVTAFNQQADIPFSVHKDFAGNLAFWQRT